MSVTKLNVYVVHVESFQFRKITCERLRETLEKDPRFKVKFHYITEFDPQNISQEHIRQFINYEQIKDEPHTVFNPLIKNLHVNHLSNSLKHRKAIQFAMESNDDEFNIVLEDDAVFNDNIADALYTALKNIPEDYDVFFLGLPSSKESEGNKFQQTDELFKVLPACDSYVVSKTAAKKLYEDFAPVKFTHNIHMSYLIAKNKLHSHLAIPNIFIDGSKLGLYFSSLEVNNRLIFNQDYIQLAKLVHERTTFTDEQKQHIHKLFTDVKLKTNPEFYYLKALYETKIGNHVFAKAIYDYAFDLYETNGTIMNNQSTFLRDYMRVFKNLQNIPVA